MARFNKIYCASYLSGPLDQAEIIYYRHTMIWTSKEKRKKFIESQDEKRKNELQYTAYEIPRTKVPISVIKKYANIGKEIIERGQPFADYRHQKRF